MQRASSGDIEKCINLAIKFEFIDDFIENLIKRAGGDTERVNILLEYVDYLSNPEKIIS